MEKLRWWQEGVIYQIYPRSFQDSNGDGVGDIKGIISRLDYLSWLGVKGVWLSPIFTSPMMDFGYDITDYVGIDPVFGTMEDFDHLMEEVKKRDMKLLLDLVPNHTSDQHPWFKESRSSRNSPKRDWYMWRDAKPDGTEPNNWLSAFHGSGWEWDEQTKQYYFHTFRTDQPDLNWRNEEVQKAILDVMRFWLRKGVDGFRIDMLHHMVKDEHFRNNPTNPNGSPDKGTYSQQFPVYSSDQFYIHTLTAQMRKVADEFPDKVLLGELYVSVDKLSVYYGTEDNGIHLPFNFQLLNLPWDPMQIAASIAKYDAGLPDYAWPNWVISNHDRPRIAGRVGMEQAKNAAILLMTLRGTPIMSYSDELGMKGTAIPVAELQDPQGKELLEVNLGRDPMRTPMLWDDSLNAGFSNGKPWLRIDKEYKKKNVEQQQNDKDSLLMFYHRLIRLRQSEPSLLKGHYYPVHADEQVLSFLRKVDGHQTYLIVLNLSHRPCFFRPKIGLFKGKIVEATSLDLVGENFQNEYALYGDEGVIVKLDVCPIP